MVLDEENLRINTKMDPKEVKHKEYLKCEVVCKKEFEECRIRCFDWEEKYKKAVERCVELEFEVQKKKSENVALEAKFMALETEKLGIENELKSLKEANEFKEQIAYSDSNGKVVCGREKETERVVDLTEEEDWEMDKVVHLMIENKCLECEKKRTENDLEVWKEKFKELESWVIKLEENSLLKSGQSPLPGIIKLGLGLPKVDSNEVGGRKEWIGANKSNFGSHTGTSLHHLQTEEEVVNLLGVGSTFLSPGKGLEDQQAAAATPHATPYKHASGFKGEKRGVRPESEVEYGRVRRHLAFEEERSPNKKMAPSTPGGARPSSRDFIDICDSDDEPNMAQIQVPTPKNQQSGKVCISTGPALRDTLDCEKEIPSGNRLKSTVYDSSDEDDIVACKDRVPFISTPKRKRASNIVTSDTDSDDDNIPICKLKRMHIQESIPVQACSDMNKCSATATAFGVDNVTGIVTPSRRRLMTLRQVEGQMEGKPSTNLKTSETKHHPGIPTTGDIEDDESDEVESESEGESLGGFIVSSSDDNDGGGSSESQDVSDGDTDFDEILSKIHRNRDLKLNWGFEADMLAAFGKDIELCMKAVCALYRQQTSEEKNSKETLHNNGRGFSKFDALRGSTLAEFLTDGDPQGDLKKSVKELQEYDPTAFGLCRTLATHYSKQLFEIFKNKEDPLFLPS